MRRLVISPYSDCPEGFETVGIFEGRYGSAPAKPFRARSNSERIGDLLVGDFIEWSSPATHIVHKDGTITGSPTFKYDFTGGVNAFRV